MVTAKILKPCTRATVLYYVIKMNCLLVSIYALVISVSNPIKIYPTVLEWYLRVQAEQRKKNCFSSTSIKKYTKIIIVTKKICIDLDQLEFYYRNKFDASSFLNQTHMYVKASNDLGIGNYRMSIWIYRLVVSVLF